MKPVISKNLKTALLASVLILFSQNHAEAKNCKKGKPCGNSCIAQKDVCHKEAGSATSEPTSAPTAPAAQAPAAAAPQAAAPVNAPASTSSVSAASSPVTAPAAAPSAPAKVCKKGKACGNACIPQDAVCHI